MKPASNTLINLLLTKDFVQADLYTITLIDGAVLRYAALDVDALANGFTFVHQPYFERQDSRPVGHWKIGVDTDTWQVHVIPRNINDDLPDQINGQPWIAALKAGVLDGASVKVERAYFGAWPEPWTPTVSAAGTVTIFAGRVAEVDFTRVSAIITINSWMELFSQEMPRNLFQSGCRFTLFGPGCSLSAASFAVNSAVGAGSDTGSIVAALGQATGYFSLGRLVMTSGLNATFSRGVKSWDLPSTTLKLRSPFPFALAQGDTFTVYPGCDKQLATCDGTFANKANFGGFPFIPAPENAV